MRIVLGTKELHMERYALAIDSKDYAQSLLCVRSCKVGLDRIPDIVWK